MRFFSLRTIFALLFTLFIASCATESPVGKTEAEVLYKKALKSVEDGRYIQANEYLNTIKTQHPYSFYATHAELLLADIQFLQEQFVESAASYLLFKDMHPKHDKIVYVTWKIGESYYNQIPSTFDRDLAPAKEAIKYYTDIVERYGKSEYVEKAKARIIVCREMIIAKERYIADFYFRVKKYEAARYRYKVIIDEFEDKDLLNHSKLRVIEASYKIGDFSGCINYSDKFFKDLPQTAQKDVNSLRDKCKKELSNKKEKEE